MYKVTNYAGEEITSEDRLARAYQKASNYTTSTGKDVCVWDGTQLNAIFVYKCPTVIVKPQGSLTLVIVSQISNERKPSSRP